MSPRWIRASLFVLFTGAGICLTLAIARGQQEPPRPVAELLPEGTLGFLGHDGLEGHRAGWEQTAAHEALDESGLMEFVEKLLKFASQRAGSGGRSDVERALRHIQDHGVSLAVSRPEGEGLPIPQVTIVLHEAAEFEPMLSGLATSFGLLAGVQFEQADVRSRSVTRGVVPNAPGIEIGIWSEGGHLLLVAGRNAVARGVAVAAGEAPNVTANPIWRKYDYTAADFEATSVGWLDFASVRDLYGSIPVHESGRTVNDLLRELGLHNLQVTAYQSGFKGRSLWSETLVEIDGPPTGLLALADQEPMTLGDLPPLPANTTGFYATRMEPTHLWPLLTRLVRMGAAFGTREAAEKLENALSNPREKLGFDPQMELLEPLGDVVCVYSDPDQGFFGTGTGAAVKVDDAGQLKSTLDRLIARAVEAAGDDLQVHRTEKRGRELVLFEFAGRAQAGAFAVDDEWLILGLMPQTVDAALLRLDGRLARWRPTPEQQEALAELPKEFSALTIGDPRVSWKALIKLAPTLLSAGQAALKENRILSPDAALPITMADVPSAELVAQPLFPNVTVRTVEEGGLRTTSRRSLPGVPLIGGVGEGSTALTAAVATALLLPAVQQAREAARRTQSRNNLKQIGLALHNYHSVNKSFPPGTHPNEKLKPDERLSWIASILPYLDQEPLHKTIDFEAAWDEKVNQLAAETRLPAVMHPSNPNPGKGHAPTHYVGIAGVGKDAPSLPVTSKRAGVFGINRKTGIRDITDGTSNTIMVSESSGEFGPWISGGQATIRALTTQPYINGPDGIGGPSEGGCNVLFADGAVRFVSENVDPTVFEALSTMAGGEVIGPF